MKKDNEPLFISFKWCLIPCSLYAVITVLIKEFTFQPLPIFLIWFLLKAIFAIINYNYFKNCQKAERIIWKQNAARNIGFDEIQKKYPTTTFLKKLKDSFLLSNLITIIFLLYEIIKLA